MCVRERERGAKDGTLDKVHDGEPSVRGNVREGNLCDAGPDLLVGGTQDAEDAEQLINLRVTCKAHTGQTRVAKDGAGTVPQTQWGGGCPLGFLTGEEGPLHHELGKDASNRPDVNRGRVVLGAQEDLGSAVPQGDNLQGGETRGQGLSSGRVPGNLSL